MFAFLHCRVTELQDVLLEVRNVKGLKGDTLARPGQPLEDTLAGLPWVYHDPSMCWQHWNQRHTSSAIIVQSMLFISVYIYIYHFYLYTYRTRRLKEVET